MRALIKVYVCNDNYKKFKILVKYAKKCKFRNFNY